MPRIQKRPNRVIRHVVAEDGFDLFGSQRLFGVIALDEQVDVVTQQFAQETPGIAAGGSGAFVKKVDGLIRHYQDSFTC